MPRQDRDIIIAVDFDGTLVENKWPTIGCRKPKARRAVIFAQTKGAKLILHTCRTGRELAKAILWCESIDITFDTVNANIPSAIARFGGDSVKPFADYHFDDSAIGYDDESPQRLVDAVCDWYGIDPEDRPNLSL